MEDGISSTIRHEFFFNIQKCMSSNGELILDTIQSQSQCSFPFSYIWKYVRMPCAKTKSGQNLSIRVCNKSIIAPGRVLHTQ